jgi:hypothetical protein
LEKFSDESRDDEVTRSRNVCPREVVLVLRGAKSGKREKKFYLKGKLKWLIVRCSWKLKKDIKGEAFWRKKVTVI